VASELWRRGGRKDIIILRTKCCVVLCCVCEKSRFRVLVILFPYLSTAYEQIRALQTRVVTEQTVCNNSATETNMVATNLGNMYLGIHKINFTVILA
jgi:hypothetical protein